MTETIKAPLYPVVAGWFFGMLFLAIGLVNTFWGNDAVFGLCIALAALSYFPPVHQMIHAKVGINIPRWSKIVLGFLILWASLGVGELFDKVGMMLTDLR